MWDKCGVIGIVSTEDVATPIFYGLRALQHRGQESAGISILAEGGAVRTHKALGLVDQAFTSEDLARLSGRLGIGHVRYGTAGGRGVENAQPLSVESVVGTVALAHNGDVVNAPEHRERLKLKGWGFVSENDSEVVVRMLANELAQTHNPVKAIKDLMSKIRGAYCFLFIIGERLFAVRDPLAIKPLVLGEVDGSYIVASETTALDVLGAEYIRDVEPGEILELTPHGFESHSVANEGSTAHCFFEHVYFARSDSVLDGVLVHDARSRIGARLWEESPADVDIVVPVPDSGRAGAQGLAEAADLPYKEALIKNRYVHRTFIMPGQDTRELNVKLKLNPIKRFIEGRRVMLVDDSIVRGTTMRRIVHLLRDAGAKEVHVRITSPPIVSPCYLGIDMHTRDQLVAANHSVDEIRTMIDADSLAFVSLPGLVGALGFSQNSLCLGCVTGAYPVEIPGERLRSQTSLGQFKEAGKVEKKTV
ncbi:MAG: amidophosphoribosyltransferase [Euryarchaeota archaeon]|nr:amidophosphoribosyltransferase [Euryarchaeota archaeon]